MVCNSEVQRMIPPQPSPPAVDITSNSNQQSSQKDSQEIQATQINEDLTGSQSQCKGADQNSQDRSKAQREQEEEKPWATLHRLSSLVPTVRIRSDVNRFGIGRHRGKLPEGAPFRVDLVIQESGGPGEMSVSRWHALIQRRGLEEEEDGNDSCPAGEGRDVNRTKSEVEEEKPSDGLIEKLIRARSVPNTNGGKVVDHSANGTFINGKKCERLKWTKLEHGDEIALCSVPGNVNKPNTSFVWLVSIPSQNRFPMHKLPAEQSLICKQIYDRYDFLQSLGKGAFATTWKAFDRNTGEYRAIKVIKKSPNIVKFYDSYQDENLIWIVLELVDGGEFLDYVVNANGLDEDCCRWITRMLLRALDYLSKHRIAHRDLKPENILMSSGTPAYVAPEVVVPNRYSSGYTVAVDMYSLGVIVYASLGNCSPFDGQDMIDDFKEYCRRRVVNTRVLAQLRPDLSQSALDFIKRLTEKDVKKRLTPSQALKHSWILGLEKNRSDCGTKLPENPVKTVTIPGATENQNTSVQQQQPQPQPRNVLGSSDLNVDLDETKPIRGSKDSLKENIKVATKADDLDLLNEFEGPKLRDNFLETGISSLIGGKNKSEESVESSDGSGVTDEQGTEPEAFSQQLKEMRLETPLKSSNSRIFQFEEEQDSNILREMLRSTPSQFKGIESEEDEGEKDIKTTKKGKEALKRKDCLREEVVRRTKTGKTLRGLRVELRSGEGQIGLQGQTKKVAAEEMED
ncbi:kinase-like domain-containing protein [Phakopsora pachyrhizi]|uniref:Kinase-like domain-containing protein n=1 Tax=Phakopsora pachyrhizi TaxID=170000 RepID=A0AAV0AI41_PHAPC|nr:kinase-like domain-containing protein [Phakopsora pachyrhizi]